MQGADNAALRMRGSHWTARRVMVWNNGPNDDQLALADLGGNHNTLEDCAIFGKGRIVLTAGSSQSGPTYNIIRRCWLRFESASGTQSPDVVGVMGYAGQSNVIFENMLATRDRQSGSTYGHQTWPPIVLAATADSQVLGSIVWRPAGAKFEAPSMFESLTGGGCREVDNLCFPPTARNLIKDSVAVASPQSASFGVKTVELDGFAGSKNVVENLVGITGSLGFCESRGWKGCETIRWGTTIEAAIGPGKSIWHEVPGICKRYVNGQFTNDPLWPWPMNQRIKDALVQSGRALVDITATMEQLFGPIPSQCSKSR